MKQQLKDEIKEIYNLEHLQNGLSYKKIQLKYNIPRGTWYYYIQKYNLKYDGRKYRCNDGYFDNIDTYNKAYILGFLYGDGCITNDGRVSILLNIKDIEILELIKREICPNTPLVISNYQNIKRDKQIKLRFKSLRIYNKLKELGFHLNKTKQDSDIFKYIPEKFKLDFIRGYLDADGNVRCQLRGKYWTFGVNFCNGNIEILKDIKDYFSYFLNITNTEIKTYKNKSEYYVLAYYKKEDVFNICNVIYNNNLFALQRKKKLALKVVELFNNTEVNK